MATNSFFASNHTARLREQDLAEALIVESIQIHGRDFFYVPRTLSNFDALFGEDVISNFEAAIPVEMIMANVTQWDGQGSFLNKFGLADYDEATIQVSIKRFKEEVSATYTEIVRPREGDILVFPTPYDEQNRFYEITRVEKESPFYQLGSLYLYTMYVRVFEYNGESFNTGNEDIDAYEQNYTQTMEIVLEAGDDFIAGEEVSQITGFSASVVMMIGNKVILSRVSGEFDNDQPLVGTDSGFVRMSENIETSTGNDTGTNDNDLIDTKVDDGLISQEYDPLMD